MFKCCKTTQGLSTWALFLFGALLSFTHSHTASRTVSNSIARTHSHSHTHTQCEHSLFLCLAHMKCRTWNMLFCPLAKQEGRRENLHLPMCVCVCGVGVENVFWQVSLMRSFYEICKPAHPTNPLPAWLPHPLRPSHLLVCHSTEFEACCWNCNWADCIGMSWLSLWINGDIDGISRAWGNMQNERGCN